ncbi:hypothetical protein SISNIDRAFT_452707, partial [Sistotremastrum niveocremeum HHB9708]
KKGVRLALLSLAREQKVFKENPVQPPNVLEESLATFCSSRLYEASASCHRTPLKDAA